MDVRLSEEELLPEAPEHPTVLGAMTRAIGRPAEQNLADHGYLSAHLVKDGECDFPYLKKEAEEAEDFWHVLDNEGKTILLLGFCVKN